LLLEVLSRYGQDTYRRITHLLNRACKIGGASTRTAAVLAAKNCPGTVIPHGKERAFITSLPIQALADYGEPDIFQVLSRWGIKTVGELASLPQAALVARVGQQGILLQKIARGEEIDFFALFQPQPTFEEKQELEHPLDSLEPLIFILGRMLESLCTRLTSRGLAAERLHLCLQLDAAPESKRTLRPAAPLSDSRSILSLLRLHLQEAPPSAPITGVSVQIEPIPQKFSQYSLLYPPSTHPDRLSRILSRLELLAGKENVGSPRILDSHHPDPYFLKPMVIDPELRRSERSQPLLDRSESSLSLSLRRLRPPAPISIRADEIISCAGPWRSSGDWWKENVEERWSRDEWDVELKDGRILRIFWDQDVKEWFLEGIYD